MALFCAAFRKDSVSLLRFPFLSHVNVFLCEISLVCRLKYPYSCFSSHFCFLVIVVLLIFMLPVLQLVFLCTFYVGFESSYWCIDAIFNVVESSFSSSCLSMSSLGCKALCIVIILSSDLFLEVFSSSISRMVPNILLGWGKPRSLSLW